MNIFSGGHSDSGAGAGRAAAAFGGAPLNVELFSGLHLEAHARGLASQHTTGRIAGDRLLPRLTSNEASLAAAHTLFCEALQQDKRLTPAGEWFVDNYHLIQEQIRTVRRHLPRGYERELPQLVHGSGAGTPRVYDLVNELIAHSHGRLDLETLRAFVRSYQLGQRLTLGELWAVPIMVRLALTENLRRVIDGVTAAAHARSEAARWVARMADVASHTPHRVVLVLAELVAEDPPLHASFVAELASRLQAQGRSLAFALTWLEERLAERGENIAAVFKRVSGRESENQVFVGNVVSSLRLHSATNWRDFVEALSIVETRLREDPARVYAEMDFTTRDHYRHAVEAIAKRSAASEEAVAVAALDLARAVHAQAGDAQAYPEPRPTPQATEGPVPERQRHVGYFLIGDGRRALERAVDMRLRLGQRVRRGVLRARGPLYSATAVALCLLATLVFLTSLAWVLQVVPRLNAAPPVAAWPTWLASFDGPVWRAWAVWSEWTAWQGWTNVWRWLGLGAAAALGALAFSQIALATVQGLAMWFARPSLLPRLDFTSGIPPAHRTAVAVPAMLTDPRTIDALLEALEVRFLANADPNLVFVLLTDFRDAPQAEMPGDAALYARACAGIHALNAKYPLMSQAPLSAVNPAPGVDAPSSADAARFYLFHRERRFNATQDGPAPRSARGIWMGWERKRGKLEHFMAALHAPSTAFTVTPSAATFPPDVRYLIALDADTDMPRDAARRLVATLAHPLNQPRYDAVQGRVVEGYGILQPQVGNTMASTGRTPFSRLFAGQPGIDPYTRAVSDVYQDLFDEGSFVGKGIYDVAAFRRALEGKLPDNRILSHDLLEGAYARAGYVSDIVLFEDYPAAYADDVTRRQRWLRGDWQIAAWLRGRVPGPSGARVPNALSALSRWKILDNLRRSLVPVALMLLLVAGWSTPALALLASAWALIALTGPSLVSALTQLARRPELMPWRRHLGHVGGDLRRRLGQAAFGWVCLPYEAWLSLSALVRSASRLSSGRNLLEWQTAGDAARRASPTLARAYLTMATAPGAALGTLGLLWLGGGPTLVQALAAGPWLAAWALAPWLVWHMSRPSKAVRGALSLADTRFLRGIARRTWRFFETFVSPLEGHLPPDNYQVEPFRGIATRTSPTNIGLALTANLAAYDFGYLSAGGLLTRTHQTLASTEGLQRFQGHLYNWYDTRTLQPLEPRYVSTVDSGNLAGHLLILAAGLGELGDHALFSPAAAEGLKDTLRLLQEAIAAETPGQPAAIARDYPGQQSRRHVGQTPRAAARGWESTERGNGLQVLPGGLHGEQAGTGAHAHGVEALTTDAAPSSALKREALLEGVDNAASGAGHPQVDASKRHPQERTETQEVATRRLLDTLEAELLSTPDTLQGVDAWLERLERGAADVRAALGAHDALRQNVELDATPEDERRVWSTAFAEQVQALRHELSELAPWLTFGRTGPLEPSRLRGLEAPPEPGGKDVVAREDGQAASDALARALAALPRSLTLREAAALPHTLSILHAGDAVSAAGSLSTDSGADASMALPADSFSGLPIEQTAGSADGFATRSAENLSADAWTPASEHHFAGGAPGALAAAVARGAMQARARLHTLETLAARARALADVDYALLYDPERALLAIGYNVSDQRRDDGYYDLLASEARLASFVAIAQGKLPQAHWFSLGRLLTTVGGEPALLSWSGSMFEYLMPLLVMPSYRGTLLDETYRGVIARQIAFGRAQQVPWGISESGYAKTDLQLNFQYRAFGVPGLGFKRGLADDLVITPYATALALMVEPAAACSNLRRLERDGYLGPLGFYEAIDFTPERLSRDQPSRTIASYMAHHQGMSLLALDYALLGQPMQRRFSAEPALRATELLLQERLPRSPGLYIEPARETHAARSSEPALRVFASASPVSPQVQLLSNGSYHVMVTEGGGGYSRWRDLAVTRWREDPTSDSHGTFAYLRDLDTGDFWPASHRPTGPHAGSFSAIFSQGRAEFRRRDGTLDTHIDISVSPEDDIELRHFTLTEHSRAPRRLELTSFAEVVLATPASDSAHPAFSNLFVQTEILEAEGAVLCTRRPRSGTESPPWMFHLMTVSGTRAGGPSFETARADFIGRGRDVEQPQALFTQHLGGSAGAVLDPVVAIRNAFTLAPGETAHLCIVSGVAETRDEALRLVEKYSDASSSRRVFDLSWTHNQVLARRLDASAADTQLYERLASHVLYASAVLRAPASVVARNVRGQAGLWPYAISGDLPIVLLRIADRANVTLVRQVVQAHAYFRMKGLATDLIIWNEDPSSYRQALHDDILSIISARGEADQIDRPAGIFLRRGDQIAEEDKVLMQAVARVVLSDGQGSLADQLGRPQPRIVRAPAFNGPAPQPQAKLSAQHARVADLGQGHGRGGNSPKLFSAQGDSAQLDSSDARSHAPGFTRTDATGLDAAQRSSTQAAAAQPGDTLHGTAQGKAVQGADLSTAVRTSAASHATPGLGDVQLGNGLGGFSADGREYLIHSTPGAPTPAPWVNVLANRHFGSVVSESGSAYTWCENARNYRLTPWHNDPISDPSGEAFYLRDEESGDYWSPTPAPAGGRTPYLTRHGFGYSAFEHAEGGIESKLTTFVALDAPLKFNVITLTNTSARPRRLSVTAYCELVLGENRAASAPHVVTEIDVSSGALVARNAYSMEFPARVAFLECSSNERTVSGDRLGFIGRQGTLGRPAFLESARLSNRVGAALDPCLAMQVEVELYPGEEREVAFIFGSGRDLHDVHTLLYRFRGTRAAHTTLEAVEAYWQRTLGAVQVSTPDPAFDILTNGWLIYQVLAARMWGRSGFYQSGGAYGFRDQLQDAMALLHCEPAILREHIVRAAGRQFVQGDVQHWWHPPQGRGVRTRISDDYLWLPYAVCRYVAALGDTGVLSESAPFLEGRLVKGDEESYYDMPAYAEESGTVYEHCRRAVEHGLRFGAHDLPLMGCGDWNDGMNLVGHDGRGESVWLAFFLHDVLTHFAPLARQTGDDAFAERCDLEAAKLHRAIEAHGWDGEWYRRAYFDNGEPLGSASNIDCQIDALPQAWATLTGLGDPDRARTALASVDARLVRPDLGVIKLFEPPFDIAPREARNGNAIEELARAAPSHSEASANEGASGAPGAVEEDTSQRDATPSGAAQVAPIDAARVDTSEPGYIKGYVPGVRENGGQYTHAAVWVVMAHAAARNTERAWDLFNLINPLRHSDSPAAIARYKVEPYVMAADVYTNPQHAGRGGWTWYTGSAAWMYRLALESLIGLSLEPTCLRLAPLLPAGWRTFTVTYRHHASVYHVTVNGPESGGNTLTHLTVDGHPEPSLTIPLTGAPQTHTVTADVA